MQLGSPVLNTNIPTFIFIDIYEKKKYTFWTEFDLEHFYRYQENWW